jgi:N-acetyl-gamma-glutamylphosphate reductase
VTANTKFIKIKTIITGATGMVGEGVLLECLNHPDVEQVLVINRKPGGVSHPKLREIIHVDFFNLAPIEQQLTGLGICLTQVCPTGCGFALVFASGWTI